MTATTTQPDVRPDASPENLEDPVIVVDGLVKRYGDREVLRGMSFTVSAQEIFGILGPNGAGKTSAVEAVQGLRSRDGGSVRVLGIDPARERHRLRHVLGSQLQSSALPDRLRVGEALRLFARLAGEVEDWRRLMETWDLVRLEKTAFGSLSGGERQRLFIALALVNQPKVVFLDELTQGLDPSARRDTWRLIRRIREQGTTVVLVSHYMDEVEQLCDRVGVLHGGVITACDTPERLVTTAGGSVRTRFTGDSDGAHGLERVSGVQSVSFDGKTVEVVGDSSTPVRVAAELAGRGVVPPDFAVIRPSLEDVFVTLTAGGKS